MRPRLRKFMFRVADFIEVVSLALRLGRSRSSHDAFILIAHASRYLDRDDATNLHGFLSFAKDLAPEPQQGTPH